MKKRRKKKRRKKTKNRFGTEISHKVSSEM